MGSLTAKGSSMWLEAHGMPLMHCASPKKQCSMGSELSRKSIRILSVLGSH